MRIRRILGVLILLVIVFIAVIIVKTLTFPFYKPPLKHSAALETPFAELSLKRLQDGLRIPTISQPAPTPENMRPFVNFKDYLTEAYPNIHAAMQTDTVNTYGLLFRWPGSDPTLPPFLITAHYDVAPVPGYDAALPATFGELVFRPGDNLAAPIDKFQTEWEFAPFSGAVANGRIYGRGTLDDKAQLFAILEAAEALIAEDYQPRRDIWFAFGHDEEIGGQDGALQMANYFEAQGLYFDAVHDEGGVITSLAMISPKAVRPVAVVGVAEKGFLVVKITVNGPGGHSSMPPRNASIVQAAEIVAKLNANQMPAKITPPIAAFLERAGGEMGFGARMAIANQWLLRPAIIKIMTKAPPANALLRTTTAVTMIKGGDAPNVLSPATEIIVNFRILPEDTPEDVLAHVEAICAGYDVKIEAMGAPRTASKISPSDSAFFQAVESSVLELYPDGIVSPYITIASTDAIKYELVSDNVYRFMPAFLNQYELALMHGVNEHISIENYSNMIRYYQRLMQNY